MNEEPKIWELAFDARFKWTRTPEGRGYLFDEHGQQAVDEVIMKDWIQHLLDGRDDALLTLINVMDMRGNTSMEIVTAVRERLDRGLEKP